MAEAGAVVWSCGPEVLGTASVTPPLTAKALTIRPDRVRARLRTDASRRHMLNHFVYVPRPGLLG